MAGEDELIARYFAPLAGRGGLGLLDDAAMITPEPGCDLVCTADAVVAGIHFRPADSAGSIACKALGVNLSDLAAKGSEPIGYLLTLALPSDWTEEWLGAFCTGLGETAREHACPLLGGDTVVTPGPLTISITALGTVPSGTMVRRTAAQPGELVCVTGSIGDAVLGLSLTGSPVPDWAAQLDGSDRDYLIDRYRKPRPRTALARAVRQCASAAMDVSDGLTGDLAKLLRVSGLGGCLDLDAVPFSLAAQRALAFDPSLFDAMISGGDDYEILLTVHRDRFSELLNAARSTHVPLTIIGQTTVATGLGATRVGQTTTLVPSAYSHLRIEP